MCSDSEEGSFRGGGGGAISAAFPFESTAPRNAALSASCHRQREREVNVLGLCHDAVSVGREEEGRVREHGFQVQSALTWGGR